MTIEEFASEFILLFPQSKASYDELKEEDSEFPGHVFFGDMIDEPLASFFKENSDKQTIKKYIGFNERMYSYGDDYANNVIEVTILEYLGDNDNVLKNAFNYFSDALIEASKQV